VVRSVYVTGAAGGDGRQIVELGVMELLAGSVERFGVFCPMPRSPSDPGVELLRDRYRIDLPAGLLYGLDLEKAAMLQAERGQYELVRVLADRFDDLGRRCDAVLVLGAGFTGADIPDPLGLDARLANEFGAMVLPVVSGRRLGADAVVAEVRNTHRAYADLGCDVLAVVANRVRGGDRDEIARRLRDECDVPVYAIEEDPALCAPTVAEVIAATGARVLLGDEPGLAREVRGFVFGGAMLPRFLDALFEGCLVITPGDRADLLVGALAAHAAGAPPIAGVLLTLGEHPGPNVMGLAARLAPGCAVAVAPESSFLTAAGLSTLEGRITAATARKAEAALGLFESRVDVAELAGRIELSRSTRVTPMMFERELLERARAGGLQDVVLAEGAEERVLRAAEVLLRRNVCHLTLLGDAAEIRRRIGELGLDLGADLGADLAPSPNADPGADSDGDSDGEREDREREDGEPKDRERADSRRARVRIIDPASSALRERLAGIYVGLRRHKGVTLEQARDVVADVNYFGALMVEQDLADGMVSGAVHSTAATLRPAFEIVKTSPGVTLVSSVFFMCLADRVLVYGDCAVNPDPDAARLAEIAIQSADTAARFGVSPRVALLSYSTGSSGTGADVDKVREATRIVRALRPDLPVEGPIQYDAAIEPVVAAAKLPDSAVAGRATVLIFPDLNTGNNTYKAVQRSAGAVAVGPVLQGLRKPVNDLSRGALVQDIVTTVAITAIQAKSCAG
jgi:phosphate acetyltransferase